MAVPYESTDTPGRDGSSLTLEWVTIVEILTVEGGVEEKGRTETHW